MWYLSRTPHASSTTKPEDLFLFTLRNSIFPASETRIFEEISIVEVPRLPTHLQMNENDKKHQTLECNKSWNWFAYLCSPVQFHSVAVPRNPSYRIQVIAVLPEKFLCAKLGPGPHAGICLYSLERNVVMDVPKMHCEDRNLTGSSCALSGGWLYVAGGYKGSPSYVGPAAYLKLAERLNLKTWEWQALPPMRRPRAFATGLAYRNKFYIVGGCSTLKHSAEIYNPSSNSWQLLITFVPEEADGFAVASLDKRLMMLTWSDRLGVKLWFWIEPFNPYIKAGWTFISFLPNQQVERVRLRQFGARMVRIGFEIWIFVGHSDDVCQVDGSTAWPVLPAPTFRPDHGLEVVHKGHINAFYFESNLRINWRQIPVYSI